MPSPSADLTSAPVRYRIRPHDPHEHVLRIDVFVPTAQSGRVQLRLPSWIPGSYLIREYAKHVIRVSASAGGMVLACKKTDKSTWEVTLGDHPRCVVQFDVYAFDRSVRGAFLDANRMYFNGAAVFPQVLGHTAGIEVDIEGHDSQSRVATTLPAFATDGNGFGRYKAADYDALLDYPVEVSRHDRIEFAVRGVPHALVVTGAHRTSLARIAADAEKICATHVAMFHGDAAPAFSQYLFLLNVVPEGYGGLEHRDSTSLVCAPTDLPIDGDPTISEGYLQLLGLISHEYFHAWNVKRIRPAQFVPYDLTREAFTRQLWMFEGFTSYYDDLALVRAGVITRDDYLRLIGRNLTALARNAGRNVQSVAESSFDAWIKYYRQDENSQNAGTSYYLKGGLVGLLLDLTLRTSTAHTLDDVMRSLWQRWLTHGNAYAGTTEDELQGTVESLTDRSWSEWFSRYVHGTDPLPLEAALQEMGVRVRWRAATGPGDRGGRPEKPSLYGTNLFAWGLTLIDGDKVKSVASGTSAAKAGVAAHDQLVAINGRKVAGGLLPDTLARLRAGEHVTLHVFRDQLLREITLTVPTAQNDTAWCEWSPAPTELTKAKLSDWLGAAAE
jgi:predicted metalloprotease with PDZ domain